MMAETKTRIRWGRVVGAGSLLLLVLLWPLYRFLVSSRLDKSLLTQALARATAMEVAFDTYQVSWSGAAQLHGLRLSLDGNEVLTSKSVSTSFTWGSVLRGHPDIEEIRLEEAVLTLDDEMVETLKSRPTSQRQVAVIFSKARFTYGDRLELSGLTGRYQGQELSILEQDGLALDVAWPGGTLVVEGRNLPLKVLGQWLGRELPEGEVQAFNLTRTGEQFVGRATLKSAVVEGELGYELEGGKGTLTTDSLTVGGQKLGPSKVPFNWTGEKLELFKAELSTDHGNLMVDGSISPEEADLTVTREQLAIGLKGKLPFEVEASWKEAKLLRGTLSADPWTLDLRYFDGGQALRFLDLEAEGFDFGGQVVWDQALKGTFVSEGGELQGQSIGKTTLAWRMDDQGAVQATGTCLVAKQPVTIAATTTEQGLSLTAEAKELPLSLFQPGFEGLVNLRARTENPKEGVHFEFAFSGNKEWPAATGKALWKDEEVSFSELVLPELKPPLTAVGKVHTKKHTLDFSAKLDGQKLQDIWPPSPILGQAHGQAKVTGTAAEPVPSFAGELREARWSDLNLGTVAVEFANEGIKAELADLALESVPQLKPYLAGSGKVTVEGPLNALKLAADYPKVVAKGVAVGRVQARAALTSAGLKLDSLSLAGLTLSGVVSAKELALSGKAEKFNLGLVPAPVTGRATGEVTISGSPATPISTFTGTVEDLVYQDLKFGALPLKLTMDTKGIRARVEGLKVSQVPVIHTALPALDGVLNLSVSSAEKSSVQAVLSEGTYAKKALPKATVSVVQGDKALAVKELTLHGENPLRLGGWFNPDTGNFELGATLEKLQLAPYLALLPQQVPVGGILDGKLTFSGNREKAAVTFEGAGREVLISGVRVGSVPKLNLAASSSGSFAAEAQQVPAVAVEPMAKIYPNLSGLVHFAARRPAASDKVTLTAGLTKSSLPNLNLDAYWQENRLTMTLQAATQPALVLNGTIGTSKLEVGGDLRGQSLAQLMPLGGAQPPKDVTAQLMGSLLLAGPLTNPTLTLLGPVHNLTYRGSPMGNGQLQLTVNQQLKGQLNLDSPYEASLADAAPGSVLQVPLVREVLKRAVRARITAVVFGGTPANPEITPVVAGIGSPQVPNLNLPTQITVPEVKGRDLRLNIPGADRGIKIKL